MLPTLRPGDVLKVCREELPQVATGDIVLLLWQSRLFDRRAIRHSGTMLITRGDAVRAQDPLVSASELLGVVTSISRKGKLLSGKAFRFRAPAVAYLFRRSEGSRRLVLRLLCGTLFQLTDQKLPLKLVEVMQ